MRFAARIAECEEHGLHGERERCFACGGEVARPLFWRGEVVAILVALAFLVGALVA